MFILNFTTLKERFEQATQCQGTYKGFNEGNCGLWPMMYPLALDKVNKYLATSWVRAAEALPEFGIMILLRPISLSTGTISISTINNMHRV
jgi:hypothetical protein